MKFWIWLRTLNMCIFACGIISSICEYICLCQRKLHADRNLMHAYLPHKTNCLPMETQVICERIPVLKIPWMTWTPIKIRSLKLNCFSFGI